MVSRHFFWVFWGVLFCGKTVSRSRQDNFFGFCWRALKSFSYSTDDASGQSDKNLSMNRRFLLISLILSDWICWNQALFSVV